MGNTQQLLGNSRATKVAFKSNKRIFQFYNQYPPEEAYIEQTPKNSTDSHLHQVHLIHEGNILSNPRSILLTSLEDRQEDAKEALGAILVKMVNLARRESRECVQALAKLKTTTLYFRQKQIEQLLLLLCLTIRSTGQETLFFLVKPSFVTI